MKRCAVGPLHGTAGCPIGDGPLPNIQGGFVDLKDAIAKHAQWKYRLRTAAQSNEMLDAATISSDKACDLGKWLKEPAQARLSGNPIFAKCVREHAAFHHEAGKIAKAVNAHDAAQVSHLLATDSPFNEISKAVCVTIIELEHVLEQLRAA